MCVGVCLIEGAWGRSHLALTWMGNRYGSIYTGSDLGGGERKRVKRLHIGACSEKVFKMHVSRTVISKLLEV